MRLLPLLLLAALSTPAWAGGGATPPTGDDGQGTPAGERAAGADSPWYLERLAADPGPRPALPADDIPSVIADLTALLQDDGVPGFYDGQFAVTADRFDELVRVAQDPAFHHTMRIMAVMALQEAADGEQLAKVLDPLILPPETEYHLEWQDFRPWQAWNALEEQPVREILDGDLSRYARFALAKDGQPEKILEKIHLLEGMVSGHVDEILNPALGWDGGARGIEVLWYRKVWFDIGYHYQQFDDYENATRYFRALCDNLKGEDVRWAWYNLACIAALQGRVDEALVSLRKAVDSGFADVDWMDQDGDLASVRARPEYDELRGQLGAAPRQAADEPQDELVAPSR
ncbi:MAG: tetratricopeptide repeat protein [Planctomycetes bacterium]|nr:tetratricopeptide repeat protein [Planctomycetota bacterium]